MLHKIHLNETKQADELNKMQTHSLKVGGAYGTAVIQRFLGYCCKQNSSAYEHHFNMHYTEARLKENTI